MHPVAFGLGHVLYSAEILNQGPNLAERDLRALMALHRFFLLEWGLTEEEIHQVVRLWEEVIEHPDQAWVHEYRQAFLTFLKQNPVRVRIWTLQIHTLVIMQHVLARRTLDWLRVAHLYAWGRNLGLSLSDLEALYQRALTRVEALIDLVHFGSFTVNDAFSRMG